jgi:uncharacterized membrane protein SirB2
MNEPQRRDPTAADDETELSPEEAARLIRQTTRQAQRQFELRSPWQTLIQALGWLAIYGAIWLSVRGQHPYKGPTGWVVLIVFAFVIVIVIAASVFIRRRKAGVRGRSRRQDAFIGAAMVTAFVAAYVFMGALRYLGVSYAIVYGVYAAAGWLIVVGAAGVAIAAMREDPQFLCSGIALVAIAAGSCFAGPITVWLIMGVGGFLVLLALAGYQLRLRRR